VKLAFCLYKYFPFGGMQRNFLKIARECHSRGHQVVVYTLSWQGEPPDWLEVVLVPVTAMTAPKKYRKFSRWLEQNLKRNTVDVVVGFNKMPGLDVYYCGDPCFEYKSLHLRRWWYRFTGRYRHFAKYEKAVFSRGQAVDILMFSPVQETLFQRFYHTESSRVTMLPPGISRDRCAPENADDIREDFRREFELDDHDLLLLQIGSGFRTKGLDRTLRAIAALPPELQSRTKLYVIGQDDPAEFKSLAKSLGVDHRVTFFSGRDDVPRFLQGADILVHPSYAENTGGVILEAVVAGLPVLVTDVCGYAHYVEEAKAGELIASPYRQQEFDRKLEKMLLEDKAKWRENGLNFSKHADIYNMPIKAADVIEQVLERKSRTSSALGKSE
tara:strand:+ start:47471 stop:48625 length:1155 start_codon:yes stop_codon:yes gene_type:complete